MNDVREEFEEFFRWSRASKGKTRLESMFKRMEGGDYADDHTQRHWWTWQKSNEAATARAQRVPLTSNEIEHGRREAGGERFDFTSGVRFAERHHGITAQPSGGKGE